MVNQLQHCITGISVMKSLVNSKFCRCEISKQLVAECTYAQHPMLLFRKTELNVQCKYFKGIFRTHQRSMMKAFAKIVNGFYSLVFSAKMLRHKCYRVLNTPLYFEQRYVQDLVSPCLHLRYSGEYFYFNCTTGQKFRCTSQIIELPNIQLRE